MIRPARPDDVPVIAHLVRELAEYERAPEQAVGTDEHFAAALFGPQPAAHALIAEHESESGVEVAGFALWCLNFSTWVGLPGIHLEDLFVLPAYRGFGYGRDLLTELARICTERGYRRLEWNVLDWNEPAIGFYRALGAFGLEEWTTFRLTGDALGALAYGEPGSIGITGGRRSSA